MGKFSGILFCTDLDGTILNSEKKVSSQNKKAIEYFQREGGTFTFITGRMPSVSGDIYDMIQPNAPFGCINGGGIYDVEKDDYIWYRPLPSDVLDIIKYVYENMPDIGIQINCARNIYFMHDNGSTQAFRELTGAPFLTKEPGDIDEPICKVVFNTLDAERLLEVRKEIEALPGAVLFDFTMGSDTFFEILPKDCNKGTLLKRMADMLGFDMAKTVAVGDYENDIDMIKMAGTGYSVANACPELHAVADRITVSNEEHAIAKIIDDLDKAM
jgi:Cof subfamily protein (haloacid dehalogenase superfamily)